ncbi:AAA family ATPase [Sulfitobacter sabulilitoris]|uniref:Recombinase A n=1 Tax=Sulfitobacter sabulilitoris TaxID=2562655 RepID=A0A5S3PCU6_9RHOB|nr:AAA family ATPase [Sulfitobacter sabulilitoris]TMM51683.1 recombinase A [Sulfitobacter sabulilitoris]
MTNPKSIRTASKTSRPKREASVRKSRKDGIETFTARDLQHMDFPPLRFAVQGYIAEGLTLLAGKPKIGKSWMALDFAMAIATGGVALGSINCEQGPVLYCALEDNHRRLQRRMRKLYGTTDRWPKSFHFTTSMKRLDEGLLDDLRDWIGEYEPRLIIIDTLACIKPQSKKESGYSADYAALGPLQVLAGELGIAIVLIHHLRKMHGDDPFDMISGTTGLTGAVDAALVLQRGVDGPTLYGRGREIEEIEVALELTDGAWKILGEPSAVRRSDERNAIIKVMTDAKKPLGPKQISDALEKEENNIKQLLRKMSISNEVKKQSRGRYILPKS